MKKFKKIVIAILALVLCLPTVIIFTGCKKNPGDGEISASQVIKESVTEVESMIYTENTQETSQSLSIPLSFTAPNTELKMLYELQSAMRGSGLSLYFSDFLIRYLTNFDTNTLYKDEFITGYKFLYKVTNLENGIYAHAEMQSASSSSQMKVYFIYDYENEKPLETIIVLPRDTAISIAKFDFTTSTAYSFAIGVNAGDSQSFYNALGLQTLDFDAFMGLSVKEYIITKFNLAQSTMEGYKYSTSGSATINATEEQVKTLYNEIYNAVKVYAVPTESLEDNNATNASFYKNMYTYASKKSSVLGYNNNIVNTFINYEDAKAILNEVKTELQKDTYNDAEYNDAKTTINTSCTYLQSISAEQFFGGLTSDCLLQFIPRSVINSTDIEYTLELQKNSTWYINLIIKSDYIML